MILSQRFANVKYKFYLCRGICVLIASISVLLLIGAWVVVCFLLSGGSELIGINLAVEAMIVSLPGLVIMLFISHLVFALLINIDDKVKYYIVLIGWVLYWSLLNYSYALMEKMLMSESFMKSNDAYFLLARSLRFLHLSRLLMGFTLGLVFFTIIDWTKNKCRIASNQ